MLREWAPLTDLFKHLPIKIKQGLFQKDINLTCIDVLSEYIVLGTNVGCIYLFERKSKNILKFPCEKNNVAISCVKILSTVDYMIACASEIGTITIFQIPKSHPETLPESLRPKSKQVEKYLVTELHKGPITALEWSKNGMKLFSGDKNGLVILTEIDFYMHICKSSEILNETYPVVQLSYVQQYLSVSTTYRSIICQQYNKWKVSQIGRKDRKFLGNFGAIIVQKSYKVSESCLYCARPGLRIWIADIEGTVQNTLLFKDLISKDSPEIPIINPVSKKKQSLKAQNEASFGTLMQFDERFLITYSSETVYILDPQKMIVVGVVSQLRGVLDVAIHKDEIFILEEAQSIIRISYNPETDYSNVDANDPLCNAYFPLSTSLKGLADKLQSISPDLSKTIDIFTDETAVIYVEEATNSPVRTYQFNNEEKFDKFSKQQFTEEILYKKSSKASKTSRMSQSAINMRSTDLEEKDYTPFFMNSFTGVLPDLRSPETIKWDIAEKEKQLEKILDLDKVKVPNLTRLETFDSKNGKNAENGHSFNDKDTKITRKKLKNNDIINELVDVNTGKTMSQTNDKNSYFINKGCKQQKYSSLLESEPTSSLNVSKVEPVEVPSCDPVPKKWILSDLHVSDRKDSNLSESSLSDWEIL